MNLFWKIYSAVFISFVSVAGFLAYSDTVRHISDITKHIIRENETLGKFIATETKRGYVEGKMPFEALHDLSRRDGFMFWWVATADGEIYLADDTSFVGHHTDDYFRGTGDDKSGARTILNHEKNYGIYVRPLEIGKKNWSFWLGFSLTEVAKTKRNLILLHLSAFSVAVVALGIILYFLIKHYTRPIQDLSTSASILGSGDLAHRVKFESTDEMGRLAEAFNTMAGRLQERTAELKTRNEDLVREIAERKIAEQALRESESNFRFLADHASDVIWTVDLKMCTTYVSPSVERILGFTPEERMHQDVGDQLTADSLALARQRFIEELRRDKGQGVRPDESVVLELDYLHKKGSVVTLESMTNFIRDEQGTPTGIHGVSRDITERKKAEEALRQSEEKYRVVVEKAQEAILVAQDGVLRFVNPKTIELVSYAEEELIGKPITNFLYPDDREMVLDRHMRRLRGEVFQSRYTFRVVEKGGAVKWVEIDSAVISWEGRPAALIFMSDITERKGAEEALRKSEEFNRGLMDHAPFGIVYLSGDGTIEYANPATNRIAGIPDGQVSPVLGQNIFELPGLKDRLKAQEIFRRLVEGEPLSDIELPYTSSMGRDTLLLVAATPRFGTDGTVAGAILMFTNISERKRAEQLQIETARYRAVADLAGGVAHNFNNLLQIVIGNLELALMDLERGNFAHIRDSLEKVLESSRFGAETVRRLQSFAGIRDHVQVPQRGVFDLTGIVRHAAEMSRTWWKTIPEKQGRRVSLNTRLQDGCLVQCEKNELFDVVVNLVKNATEAIRQDGVIDIETRVEGDRVILEVMDTGVGMSEQNLQRLFNPFFTTKAQAGSGLGLASSRKIIENCGGNILAKSSEGKGATFTIVLPLVKEEPKPRKADSAPAVVPPLKILAIDDEFPVLDVLKNALTRYNCEVSIALSGEEGLDIFKATPVEVVICDLGMPGMTGWEVGKRIRALCQERGIKKTPFILLTGWGGQKTEAEKIAESGVDVVVEKPLDIKNILESVREVTEERLSQNSDE
jgi:two-component system, cell cycle sensor histidine kinase and response regulator CckA